MQSFRSEIENPLVEKDIIELEKKIRLFREGKIDEEKFRSLRLARGVYGQRQQGVQMVRIKLPYGKVNSDQLIRIADVSDEYSTGRLHITTRQDIQIHHVSLDHTPELWSKLEQEDITLREACGNTLRNVTASPTAGIDPDEPFDVSPYAHAVFQFFLRNPFCQEMGRKFKISFSATDKDDALAFMHDLGFIAKVKDGLRGFKVLLGGGLGSQPNHGIVIHEFLESKHLIPLIEGVLRVFDRYGEREKRHKARLKFLVNSLGVDEFLSLIEQEQNAIHYKVYEIDVPQEKIKLTDLKSPRVIIEDITDFELWKRTNVFAQKQEGLFAIGIRVHLGDFKTAVARQLAKLMKDYGGDELRFTLRQDILLRHIKSKHIPFFYQELKKLGLADPGYNRTRDITACPGTDTCNLGIASSTGIARELEKVIENEYPQYLEGEDITIKISGCMNACGQHNMAQIGFQGMSIRAGKMTAPGLQVLLGGGILGDGQGRFADKVIKIPSKRGSEALRRLFDDFEINSGPDEVFLKYYDRQGKIYFYELLKDLAETSDLQPDDFIDWGHSEEYVKAIGIGECAGVVIDLVTTLLFESQEKLENAHDAYKSRAYADAIYHTYSSMVNTAKALLAADNHKTNTHAGIITLFDEVFVSTNLIRLPTPFSGLVYQIKNNEPGREFAARYLNDAQEFLKKADEFRLKQFSNAE